MKQTPSATPAPSERPRPTGHAAHTGATTANGRPTTMPSGAPPSGPRADIAHLNGNTAEKTSVSSSTRFNMDRYRSILLLPCIARSSHPIISIASLVLKLSKEYDLITGDQKPRRRLMAKPSQSRSPWRSIRQPDLVLNPQPLPPRLQGRMSPEYLAALLVPLSVLRALLCPVVPPSREMSHRWRVRGLPLQVLWCDL